MKIILLFIFFTTTNVFGIEIHAHRGGSQIYADNSLEAIQEGLSKGANYIEIDIHMTKDNKFVLSHDPKLNVKKCDFKGKELKTLIIKNINIEKLKKIQCKSRGKKYNYLVSLTEVLHLLNDYSEKKLNIEIKYSGNKLSLLRGEVLNENYPEIEDIVRSLRKVIVAQDALEKVMIQSFYIDVLRKVKNIIPEVKLSYLYKGEFNAFGMDKFLKYFKFLHKFLWFPDYKEAYNEMIDEGFDYFSPNIQQLNFLIFDNKFKSMLDVFDKQGRPFKILPWTVNTIKQKDKFGSYYDGVITDYPERFL